MHYKIFKNLLFSSLTLFMLMVLPIVPVQAFDSNPAAIANAKLDKCEFRSQMRKLWDRVLTQGQLPVLAT